MNSVKEAPSDPQPDAFGRWLCAQQVTFMLGVANLGQLPPENLPEICFAGRSNVGKSTLINAVLGRKSVARTSNTPGRTQQLNFFDLAGRLTLVDLPGYGFAKAPKQMVAEWTELLQDYLRGRVRLKRTFLLIDCRHGVKKTDEAMMTLLDQAAVPYQVIVTKADKLRPGTLAKRADEVEAVLKKHPAALPGVLITSSQTFIGIDQLRDQLGTLTDRKER